jgi:ABC-type nitrate/sulfonate/bicarbonate transport system substrate-binding protein
MAVDRRTVLKGGAATAAAAWATFPSGVFGQPKTQTINMQLGWLAGNNQLGEVAAKHLGYFEESPAGRTSTASRSSLRDGSSWGRSRRARR